MAFQQRGFGFVELPSRHEEITEIDLGFRSFRIEPLGRDILIECPLEGLAVLRLELLFGLTSERVRSLHPHGTDLIGEQGRKQCQPHT